VLGAWQHVSPTRWFESALRLATREQRQAILVKKKWVACFECAWSTRLW